MDATLAAAAAGLQLISIDKQIGSNSRAMMKFNGFRGAQLSISRGATEWRPSSARKVSLEFFVFVTPKHSDTFNLLRLIND